MWSFRKALFYCSERSWSSFSNVLAEKFLLQEFNQDVLLCDKEPRVVLKELEKHIH